MAGTYSMQHRRNLIKFLQQASRQRNLWDVFNDFIRMTALSLANSADPHHIANDKATWEAREKQYLQTIGKYEKEEQKLFPEMMAELIMELDEQVRLGEFRDILGEVFHELELHNKWKGQFFTPQSVSDLIGKISANKEAIQQTIDTYGYVSVNEPCCGAGAMLFGFLNAFRELGFNHSKQVLVQAQDVDERCVQMTYIQCSLYGIPAVVLQMNTLSLEQYGKPWFSPVYVWEGWHYKRKRAYDIRLQEQEYIELLEMLDPAAVAL